MAQTTPKMGLAAWDQPLDPYNYQQFANNWNIVDFHDHSPGRGVQIPLGGLAPGAVGATNIATNAITADQLTLGLGQSASVNQTGQTAKGAVNIATAQSTTSASYTTLATPDQVTGIILPTNGLIEVWYQATWQPTAINTAGKAGLFLNSTQVQVAQNNAAALSLVETVAPSNGAPYVYPLATAGTGLVTGTGTFAYAGDVTTGQLVGLTSTAGPLHIFVTAGTYTVSIQFKVTGGIGGIQASNRKLWVQARSFV